MYTDRRCKDETSLIFQNSLVFVFFSRTLFINKRFAHNEMLQQNASKFTIFYVSENPCSFFRFSFRATLYFYLMNALVYVNIDQGIHEVKYKVARNEKRKKLHGFSDT